MEKPKSGCVKSRRVVNENNKERMKLLLLQTKYRAIKHVPYSEKLKHLFQGC